MVPSSSRDVLRYVDSRNVQLLRETKWWERYFVSYWLFTIYMGKPVGGRFVQMERKIPS